MIGMDKDIIKDGYEEFMQPIRFWTGFNGDLAVKRVEHEI